VQELTLTVPTYNASLFPKEVEANLIPEFGEPNLPVLIHEGEGIRIVLGTHDYNDIDKPDVQIERQPNGWVLFLHPFGGCDACGYVYLLDDGRSFLLKERAIGGSDAIEILQPGEDLPEFNGRLARRDRES
jgi:hypothetical protein